MNDITELIYEENQWRYIFIALAFIVSFVLLTLLSNFIFKKLRARAQKTKSLIDDFIIRLFRLPAIWIIFSILLNIFSSMLDDESRVYAVLQKIGQMLLILTIGWLVIQGIRAVFRYFENKLDITQADNLTARRRLTKLNMIEKVLIVTAVVIFTGIALMTFEAVKGLGMSLLASAGVVGIVVGLAAQRSVGQILSGIQIAITQPIRLDDVVVIEGEWGRIEEINITYTVVKIWDERRLIIPNDYFSNHPIQNWTRTSSGILGTVFLPVSYDLPLEPLRAELAAIVKNDPNWDGRVQNIQVTDSGDWHKQIRVLVSSGNSSANWDLRVLVREKLIDFINKNYPGSFAKINSTHAPDGFKPL
ncbi:MAG: mechanosensitive ion channel [Bacteroidia bacterium]|nr:mechanosensitive ion channel [Bacteroidia bacterium]